MDTDFVVFGEKDYLSLELTLAIGGWKKRRRVQCLRSIYTYKFNEAPEIPKVRNINIEV